MTALLRALTLPLGILNLLGGLVSGIWLLVLGEWWALGAGLLAAALSALGLSLILAPGMLLFLAPAVGLVRTGHKVAAAPLLLLGNAYTVAVMAAWCTASVWYFGAWAEPDTVLPLLIWSYGVAMGPWVYMAQKGSPSGEGEEGAYILLVFAQAGYVAGVAVALLGLLPFAFVFLPVMALGFLVQSVVGIVALATHAPVEQDEVLPDSVEDLGTGRATPFWTEARAIDEGRLHPDAALMLLRQQGGFLPQDPRREATDRHLKACTSCRREYAVLQEAVAIQEDSAHPAVDLLQRYLTNSLKDEGDARHYPVEQHLSDCAACSGHVARLRGSLSQK